MDTIIKKINEEIKEIKQTIKTRAAIYNEKEDIEIYDYYLFANSETNHEVFISYTSEEMEEHNFDLGQLAAFSVTLDLVTEKINKDVLELNQIKLNKRINNNGINIVTCPNCARVMLIDNNGLNPTCPDCLTKSEMSDFPDLIH